MSEKFRVNTEPLDLSTFDRCPLCNSNLRTCETAPRASVMPAHLPSVDPLFMDAAIHDFAPMSDGEKDALMEKMGYVLYGRRK